jgi:DNA-directed RNA polymerase specialized sigma24 family protein
MIREYVPRDPREMVEEELLRDLFERYPDLMPVLDRMEINYEGLENRTLAEVARIHGYETGPVLDEVSRAIRTGRRQ